MVVAHMVHPHSILSTRNLETVRLHLESSGFVVVLHWHLSGASHPTPLAFSDFEAFCDYLTTATKPGDAIDVWPFPTEEEQRIAFGKIPDTDGRIKQGGAY